MTPVQSATFGGSSNGAPLAKKKGMEHHLDVQVIIAPVIPKALYIHTYYIYIHIHIYISHIKRNYGVITVVKNKQTARRSVQKNYVRSMAATQSPWQSLDPPSGSTKSPLVNMQHF